MRSYSMKQGCAGTTEINIGAGAGLHDRSAFLFGLFSFDSRDARLAERGVREAGRVGEDATCDMRHGDMATCACVLPRRAAAQAPQFQVNNRAVCEHAESRGLPCRGQAEGVG